MTYPNDYKPTIEQQETRAAELLGGYACEDSPDAEEAKLLPFWSVAVYLVDLARGGPEEGGWYYQCGTRIDQPIEGLPPSLLAFIIPGEQAAQRFADLVQKKLDAGVNVGRREISSVLSEGRYEARVHNGYPPAFYPERRPHYE